MQTITYKDLLQMIMNNEDIPEIDTGNHIYKYNKENRWFYDKIRCTFKDYISFGEFDNNVKLLTPIEARKRRKEIKQQMKEAAEKELRAKQDYIMDCIKTWSQHVEEYKSYLTEENRQKIESES